MRKNYNELTRGIRSRLNPEGLILEKAFRDELGTISYSDALTFVRMAMKAVEPAYTSRSKEAGDKVKEHLKSVLSNVQYRYQGSVMTDTHIRGYSDIDLLTICNKFYGWDSTKVNGILNSYDQRQRYSSSIPKLEYETSMSVYLGDDIADLEDIRQSSEKKLNEVYIDCDTSKPKAIKIKNRNLNRDVDIVTANWYDDVMSIINGKGDYRGVQVFNKHDRRRERATYPFLSIHRINERSSETNGRLKKMIRFLKNCKEASTHDFTLSSFDINAICYNISTDKYSDFAFYDLVGVLYRQLSQINNFESYANNLVSVCGREYILRSEPKKKQDVAYLLEEVKSIYLDLVENQLLVA